MAINNSSNRVLQLTQNGVPYAVSNKELDTLVLTSGQFLGGNTGAAPSAWTLSGNQGVTVDHTSTPGTFIINGPALPEPGTKSVVATTNTTAAPKTSYIASGTTSLVFTLPASAVAGDDYEFIGAGPLGATFTIQAAQGQVIFLGDTSSAAGGTATSTLSSDSARVRCVGNNTFSIYYSTGNFNIV